MEQNDLDVVKEVTERNFRSGVSAKTNKPWSMHKISLNSGKVATTFDDVEPGDTVKLTYNEEYKNYSAQKPRKADTQHDEIMNMLNKIWEAVSGGQNIQTKPAQSGYDTAKQKADELRGNGGEDPNDLNGLFD